MRFGGLLGRSWQLVPVYQHFIYGLPSSISSKSESTCLEALCHIPTKHLLRRRGLYTALACWWCSSACKCLVLDGRFRNDCLTMACSWARIRKLGITKLQADDYLMVHATLWYTVLVVAVNRTIFGGGSNFMTAEEVAALTADITRERTKGSKWVMVSEQAMILTIWSFKLCMLFIYSRLTYVLRRWLCCRTTCFPLSGADLWFADLAGKD